MVLVYHTIVNIPSILQVSANSTANGSANPIYVSAAVSNSTLAVTQSGSWSVSISGSVTIGNSTLAVTQSGTWNIATVTTITNNVGVTQQTSPWIVSGSTNIFEVSATSSANTSGNPIYVSAAISNSTLGVTESGTWTVSATESGTWTVGLNSGSNVIGKVDQDGTWNIATVTTLTGITNAVSVTESGTWNIGLLPATSGGVSFASGSVGATATNIKTSAGQIYGWYIGNSNSTAVYCQIFNKTAANVTLGTTAPDMSFYIPATAAANLMNDIGIAMGTAISIAFTTTRTGSTAPTNTVDYNFYYD
jgi:hypothetical protein